MGKAKQFWPILITFVLIAVFSYPYWAKGLVPFASDYLVTWFPPWNAHFGMPVKNGAMPDVVSQIYPWRHLTIETFKAGQWPLWNPYNFAGNPHLANFQSAVFQPFNFLFLLLPMIDAWSIMILLQPLLAGLFTYLFARELKISHLGSSVSAIAFSFCGFMVVWMAYGTLGYALLWLPLAFYAIERSSSKRKPWIPVILSISLAFSFFSGHLQTSLYVLGATLAYLLFRRKFKLLPFWVLGIGLALPQILPSWEFYQQTVRSVLFSKGEVIPWSYLVTLFSPDFYGNPVTGNNWFGHYAEWSGFFGVIPILLAAYALFRRRQTHIWFFALLGFFSLCLALPTPLLDLLVQLKIPVLATSAASRIISLFSFSGAILAGFGFDQLSKDWDDKKIFKKSTIFLVVFGFLFLVIWALLRFGHLLDSEKLVVAQRNFVLPTGLFGTFAILVFLGFRVKKNWRFVLGFALLFLLSFDLLRFAGKWMPFGQRQYVYPRLSVIDFLAKETKGIDRIFGNFGTETQTYFHLPSVEGYDPLYIKRYGEFITAAGDGRLGSLSRSTVYLNKNGQYTEKILEILGVKYIFHAVGDGRNVWAYPFWKYPDQFKLVYQDEKHEVYLDNKALPRTFLFYDFKVVKENQAIVDTLLSDNFEIADSLVLEEDPGIKLSPLPADEVRIAEITNYAPAKIEIKTESSKPGLLFLSDNYYPGWQALVDGQETKIYRADYTFRAVVVPAGGHEIKFVYLPNSFSLGKKLGAISLGIILVLTIWIKFSARKP